MEPLNLDLLIVTPEMLRKIKEVKSLAIFVPSSQNFDEDGLFSTKIFGPVGTEERNERFAYIDLNIKILHPLIYKTVINLKKMYKDIMLGKVYAVWDEEEKDLVLSDPDNGKTGFDFFIKYLKKIEFKRNNSTKRNAAIDLIEKFPKDKLLMDKLLVLPAGMRDYTVSEDGKPSEDEINDYYRKVLGNANLIKNLDLEHIPLQLVDPTRMKLQITVFELYDYIRKLLDGKNKFIQGKWAKRAMVNGTRTVITALPNDIKNLNQESKIRFNDTVVGLHQYSKAILPITIYKLKNKFINQIFNPISNTANLIDPKTLETVQVDIDPKYKDEWLSEDGINNTLNKLIDDTLKDEEVTVGDYYLMLLYDDGKRIRPVINTSAMPDDFNKKYLRPIRLSELIYLAIEDIVPKYPCLVTRYPVADVGGIYPSKVYLKTTIKPKVVKLLNAYWEEEKTLHEFPMVETPYFNALSPSTQHLALLGADFDG